MLPFDLLTVMDATMEKQTKSLQIKTATETPGDPPELGTLLWILGGFILFAVLIFAIAIVVHL